MKLLTIATQAEGYFDLLKQSAEQWGYDLEVLGWQQKWQGFAWKLALYKEALNNLPPNEPVVCVDGYDVVIIGPAEEMAKKFASQHHNIIFSDQLYFPNNRRIQRMADQVMSNNLVKSINSSSNHEYTRPCMGLFIGYAGDLLALFTKLIALEQSITVKDDQTLLNIYFLENRDSLHLETNCSMFQNLWRTKGIIYGKISSLDKASHIETYYDDEIGSIRVRNKVYNTSPCFIHAPFNLNMNMLLKEIKLTPPPITIAKDWHYFQYSISHHISRALKLYMNG